MSHDSAEKFRDYANHDFSQLFVVLLNYLYKKSATSFNAECGTKHYTSNGEK